MEQKPGLLPASAVRKLQEKHHPPVTAPTAEQIAAMGHARRLEWEAEERSALPEIAPQMRR